MYCVDGLKHNLLHICQICDRDHVVNFSSQGWEILTKNDNNYGGLRTNGNCYVVENTCAASFSPCHVTQLMRPSYGHQRLGLLITGICHV